MEETIVCSRESEENHTSLFVGNEVGDFAEEMLSDNGIKMSTP